MSRDIGRKDYFHRERNWDSNTYRRYEKPPTRKRSRSPNREMDKRRSRSPRKNDKDIIDDNILTEISKLPEPSELWDNQFQQQEGYAAPPNFSQDPSFNHNYQPSYSGHYDEFPTGPSGAPPAPSEISSWNQMSLPPPPPQQVFNVEDQIKKEAAIETEMRHQRAALSKQREDYIKKAGILKKELDTLKDQRNELRGDSKRSPSPDTKRFLKENTKLQLEIQNKLKTINNVVDMLNGIIGEEATEIPASDDSPDRASKRKSRSPSTSKKFNYVYYDPEMHWCRVCNEFPPTAKDYLNHLHSAAHHKSAAAHMEAPWHTVTGVNEGFVTFPSAPTKRTPIKGLQFFVPSTAWYCKLCDQFIGDLHCASAHLKSVVHAKNYTNFVEQNPHWETDWMSDRQKAFEKTRGNKKNKVEDKAQYTAHTITFNKDGFHTKTKSPPKELDKKKKDKKKKNKKKKESSSSSSSSSSDSDSEPVKKKKSKKTKKLKLNRHDPRVQELMSSLNVERHYNHNDRKDFEMLRNRIKLGELEEARRRGPDRVRDRVVSERREMRRSRSADRRQTESRQRDDRRDERRDDKRDDKRNERRESPQSDAKKPEIRKMPFIGKMPVFKSLGKSKTEEQKKDEEKKKEDGEALKKRQQEIDAEIQKKVAEFKEKIAKSQLEREQEQQQQQLMSGLMSNPFMLPPPGQVTPTLAAPLPRPATAPAPPGTQPPVTLPKDFQDALDIIFPSEVKQDINQDMFQGLAPAIPGFPGLGIGGVMPQFPQLSLLGQAPMMMPFEMNAPLFPRPQLYDTHVPMSTNKRNQKNNRPNPKHQNQNNQNQNNQNINEGEKEIQDEKKADRIKADLDEFAMLGIDASDVGAM